MKHYKRRSKDIHFDTPAMVLTPLTDMALILLIIFMFAAVPLSSQVADSESNSSELEIATQHEMDHQPLATVCLIQRQNGTELQVNGDTLETTERLKEVLVSLIGDKEEQFISLNAEDKIHFNEVAQVMYLLQEIPGITSISLVSSEVQV